MLLRRELHGQRIRLVGVTASNFRDREQLALFGAAEDPKRHQAAEAMDSIRRKYGERAVTRGRLVRAGVPTVFERDPNSAVEGRLGVPEAPTGRRRAAEPRGGRWPASDDGIDPPLARSSEAQRIRAAADSCRVNGGPHER